MAFDPDYNHSISIQEASEMTAKYRESRGTDTIAVAFGRTSMANILNQDGCKGLRAYYAEDESDRLTLVIVGVDEEGNDLYEGQLAELGHLCPPFCAAANPLNS